MKLTRDIALVRCKAKKAIWIPSRLWIWVAEGDQVIELYSRIERTL